MKREKIFAVALIVTAAAVVLLWLLPDGQEATRRGSQLPDDSGQEHKPPTAPFEANSAASAWQTAKRALDAAFSDLSDARDNAVGSGRDPATKLQSTSRLLLGLPADVSADAIIRELQSGRDAATGLEFTVGEEGLSGAPTWRVYLLDLLGCIDPKVAANYARQHVFTAPSSPDEWAVSLRNVMLSYPPRFENAARGEIGARLQEMLQREEWRKDPSSGMLESLDFLAHTPQPAALVPILQQWLGENSKARPDLAVQIALERTATTRPRELLPILGEDTSLLGASPGQRTLRASLMARADLGDTIQASAVQKYLHSLDPSSEEAMVFFRCFPERRFAVSPGLASQPRIPSASSLMAANNSALTVLSAWLEDPMLEGHSSSILALIRKVEDLR